MLPKPGTRTARLQRTIPLDIWARSSWVLLQEQFLPMEAAIGGRHTVMVATTIPTRGHTVAPILGATVIIIQRLTMTLPRELMAGNRLPMARTDRQQEVPATILTPGPTREGPVFLHLMEVEVRRRPITPTLEPMLRPGKVRTLTHSGSAPMCLGETRALPWVITQLRTAP